MGFADETEILDAEDQDQIICNDCECTLAQYRDGKGCSAKLDSWCDGFNWIERILGNEHR